MEKGEESRRKCAASDGLTSSKEGNKCYFNLTARAMQPYTQSQKVTLFSQRMKQTAAHCFASTWLPACQTERYVESEYHPH